MIYKYRAVYRVGLRYLAFNQNYAGSSPVGPTKGDQMSILEILGILALIWLIGFAVTFVYINLVVDTGSPLADEIKTLSQILISAIWPIALLVSIYERWK